LLEALFLKPFLLSGSAWALVDGGKRVTLISTGAMKGNTTPTTPSMTACSKTNLKRAMTADPPMN
jgi:hypothetical protein